MKSLTYTASKFAVLLIAFTLVVNATTAQNKKKERQAKRIEEVKQILTDRTYVFEATYMTPLRGQGQSLSDDYLVSVTRDSLVSYLPYAGQASQAPMDSRKNPLDFTSTKFVYKVAPAKKGGWEITILPHDNIGVQKIFITVSEEGYATMDITSNGRDAISFEGTLESQKKKV